LSLPHWFGTDLSNVPAHGPYWSVDASRIAAWRSRLAAAGRPGAAKIGLVFQANPEGAGFSDKSMQLSDIAPLLALEGIDIVNLQYGAAGRTLAAAARGIIDPGEAALPLDEYGAALAATDLLITVDTMAAQIRRDRRQEFPAQRGGATPLPLRSLATTWPEASSPPPMAVVGR